MTPESWRAIKGLFAEARELSGLQRELLLARHEHLQADVVAAVRELLKSGRDADDFLDPPDPSRLVQPLRRLTADYRGTLLGEFELLEEIGRGTSGVVYLGRQPSLGRDVAIKILSPQFSASEERRARFEREALAASKVHHPNVVSVLSFGEQSGICYLVLEYVPGRSLHAHLEDLRRKGPTHATTLASARLTRPMEAARIVEAVARGLAACHRAGVIHRDVKPHNILVDGNQDPRLVDFGLAKDQHLASLSDPGSIFGTPQYMSPEQARAQRGGVDQRSDIYSLGAVLYELLTLKPPVSGTVTTEVLRQVAEGRPEHLRLVAPHVPRSLATICMRALSKDPDLRYQSADLLAEDLARFRTGRSIVPGFRWTVRDRLSTVGHEHPWIFVTAAALLLFGLEPGASSHVEAAVPSHVDSGSGSPTSHPRLLPGSTSVANQRIEELMELLSDEPVYTHEDD